MQQQSLMISAREGGAQMIQKSYLDDYYTQPLNSKSVVSNRKTRALNILQTPIPQIDPQLLNMKSPTASMFNRHDKRARSIAINPLHTDKKTFKVKGGSPGGLFLLDTQKMNFDEENQSSVVDFIRRNQSLGKEYKNIDFERQRQLINKIHQKIKRRRDYGLDINNLFNIQACLNPKVKNHFMSNQGFFEILSEANVLNQTFISIIDQVSCYKIELGMTLQKLVESYNSIILQQFEGFYKSEQVKDKEVNHKLIYQQQATDDLISKRLEYERKLESVQAVLSSKDSQISSLQEAEEQLEKEIQYLRDMLQIGGQSQKPLDFSNQEKQPLRKKSSIGTDRNQQKLTKEDFSSNIEDLNDVLKKLEDEQNEKKNILNGMDRLLKTMLKTTKQSVGTQVEDGELIWKSQNYLGENVSSNTKSNAKMQQSSKNIISQEIMSTKQSQLPNQSQIELEKPEVETKSKLLYQPPMENYANTQKVLLLKDEEKLIELEQKLNQLSAQIKNQESDKADSSFQWSIPPHILVFIANSLEENQSGRVLPWQEFKLIIYDIYDHRIQNAGEINGVINNSYVNLEEYILLYFLDKHKLRRLAEIKLIELLTSLKYYIEVWPRAKTFAYLLNTLKPSKQELANPSRRTSIIASATPSELTLLNVDIYLQEFFLHTYSLITQEKDHFLESKDGITFLKVQCEESITQVLMTWFGDQDQRKWFHKVRRNVKKIKTNSLDDFETDYIDIDVLINMYLEEFKTKKKANQKNLSKEFMKRYQEQEGLFNTDEVDKIITACIPITSISAYVKFPSHITIRRSFLYSLVCGENGFDINTQEFIAACNRFGLDNPAPIVTKRIGFYGNDDDFEEIVKKELIKQNIAIQSKLHTTKMNNKPSLKIESARLSTSNMKSNNEAAQSNSTTSRMITPGIQNLKLLGKMNTGELESQQIMAGGVKLNIGQLGKDIGGDNQNGKKPMTQEESSINNKKIIIPSFSTTSALFSQHFSILRDLKKRIEGLKIAYYNQREEDRSWEQVEKILHVLEAACKFLDFPIQS